MKARRSSPTRSRACLAIAVGTIVVVLVLGIKLLVGNDGCEQVRAENAILKSHRDEYLQMMADDAVRQEQLLALVKRLQAGGSAVGSGGARAIAATIEADTLARAGAGAGVGAAGDRLAVAAHTPAAAVTAAAPALPAYAGKMAVLMLCYNRPQYLSKSLASMRAAMPPWAVADVGVVISQDGFDASVARVASQWVSAATAATATAGGASAGAVHTHVQHTQSTNPRDTAYHKLCQHYKWALTKAFADPTVQRVIIVEDDMQFAPDFFEYFGAMARLLDADSTLMAASAFNDNGMASFVSDSAALYRSDFFPGLGWLMTRALWSELEPKWPVGWWDDWLREPEQRKGRSFIRPEVSRVFTFGEKGSSNGEWWSKYLATQKLNDDPVAFNSAADFDLRALMPAPFDAQWGAAVTAATLLPGGATALVRGREISAPPGADLRIEYTSNSGRGDRSSYEAIARSIGLIPNVKAEVPRTAYHGVIVFKYKGRRVFLTPRGGRSFYTNDPTGQHK